MPLPTPNITTMEIKYNKDKSVTINATESEFAAICAAVAQAFNRVDIEATINIYKPIMDAINKAYNEQVLDDGM